MIQIPAHPYAKRRLSSVLVETSDVALGGLVTEAITAETGETATVRTTSLPSETLRALAGGTIDLLLVDCRGMRGTGSIEAVFGRGHDVPCVLLAETGQETTIALPPPLLPCDVLAPSDVRSGAFTRLVALVSTRQRAERMSRAEADAYRRRILEQQTEIESTSRQLREFQEDVLQHERTTAIEQLVVTVRHEINNPLATLIGRAQLLRSRGKNAPEPVVRALEEIEREALRIRALMDRLDVAREGRTTGFLDRRRIKLD